VVERLRAEPPSGTPLNTSALSISALGASSLGTSEIDWQQARLPFLQPTDRPGFLGRLGQYEIRRVIGRGGMGMVLEGVDCLLKRTVAIKVLPALLHVSDAARARFFREAQAAAALTHENIVTIHAVDQADGLPFLVLQHVSGESLEQRLRRQGRLPFADVVRIGVQAARGLAAVHEKGWVHRDIKPANILLEQSGVVSGGVESRESAQNDAPDHSPLTTHHSLLLINLTQHFAAHILLASFPVTDDAGARANYGDAQAAANGAHLFRFAIHAAARRADPFDTLDDVLAVRAVLELQAQVALRLGGHLLPVPDVTFALEHVGQPPLHFRRGNIDVRPLHTNGVADAGQHIGNGVSHHIRRFPLPTGFPDAGDQSLVGQLAKANPADAELAIHGPRSPAHLAAALRPSRKLRLALGHCDFRFTCHSCVSIG
jgi:hypothetical protein